MAQTDKSMRRVMCEGSASYHSRETEEKNCIVLPLDCDECEGLTVLFILCKLNYTFLIISFSP